MLRAALLMLLAFLTTSAAFGQKDISSSNVPDGASTAPNDRTASGTSILARAKYRGRVTERGGTRWSDFDLDLSQNPGSITMFRTDRACRHEPAAVTSDKDGIARVETKGVVTGCGDRVFELKASGDELTGTMKIYDRVFDVKATKQ